VTLSSQSLRLAIIAVALPVAWLVGAGVAGPPLLLMLVMALAGAWTVLTMGRSVVSVFYASLGIALVGYAFLDKGFAYLGMPPLFVGEVILGLAVASIVANRWWGKIGFTELLLVAFMAWGVLRTVPYLSIYSFDALRDAVIWIYATFVFAISGFITRAHIEAVVYWYRRLIVPFIVWVPVAFILTSQLSHMVPRWPVSNSPVLLYKGGDMAVHLAGVAAFILLGLSIRPARRSTNALIWVLWAAGLALCFTGRAATLSVLIPLLATIVMSWFLPRPAPAPVPAANRQLPPRAEGQVTRLVFVLLVAGIAFTLIAPDIRIGDKPVSPSYAVSALESIWSSNEAEVPNDGGAVDLQGSKEWRAKWWDTIIGYTIEGPYFWTGKGFGINLATDDGFRVGYDDSLRSPHSIHFSILARTGVPGLLVWVALQLSFALGLVQGFWRACRHRRLFWAQVDGWILAYWMAFMINGSFDVYLEGPQGGIWFWSLIGLGLAALHIQRTEMGRSDSSSFPTGRAHAHPSRP
jgi:hypothetical protein